MQHEFGGMCIYLEEGGECVYWLEYFSDLLVPVCIVFAVTQGVIHRRPVFHDFLRGAKEGIGTVVDILPSLIGLMMAVHVLRASGFLDVLSHLLGSVIPQAVLPGAVIPPLLVRLFSNSAATGLALDVFERFGPDSLPGLIVSIGLSATESVFYVMSLYLGSVGIKKSRYILPGALIATLSGVAASVVLANLLHVG